MKDSVASAWERTVLVCRKCSKRLDGGFGDEGDERLAKLLRKRLAHGAKGRKAPVGVVEVDCLKVCPKGAVVVIDAAAPREWLLVKGGTPVGEIAARLGFAAEA